MTQTNTIDDGGPAFPVVHAIVPQPGNYTCVPEATPGMSLRDYFAAKAMQGCVSCKDFMNEIIVKHSKSKEEASSGVARWSYMFADAMLAERRKP